MWRVSERDKEKGPLGISSWIAKELSPHYQSMKWEREQARGKKHTRVRKWRNTVQVGT